MIKYNGYLKDYFKIEQFFIDYNLKSFKVILVWNQLHSKIFEAP